VGKSNGSFVPESEAALFQAKERGTLRDEARFEVPEEPIETTAGRHRLHAKMVRTFG